ncbi:unnamed protein product [Rotaria sp. Silwood1]|nr:unnamed protein product [Rotaria sp. Silwood1]CAF1652264.1 unnamed protein product [Rotaria sp. Silwood1]CAF3867947.1 unnamed protein product [Rotaria sp. Silwood1]CAF3937321.1 unnamed protein product [Rotaria sp. Silwood1]CAF4888175.1 unnamed protein product [Rotaria sp. Silwood1]
MNAQREITNTKEREQIKQNQEQSEKNLQNVFGQLENLRPQLANEENISKTLTLEKDELEKYQQELRKRILNPLDRVDEIKIKDFYKELEKYGKDINEKIKNKEKIDRQIKALQETIYFNEAKREKLEKEIENFEKILAPNGNRDKRRAVLVICEQIASLEKIAAKVRKEFHTKENNIYTYDRAYKKFEKNELNPGDIIIATNISGRGTDLGINELVEVNGG